jgi:tetratricopeptide (TPR) repeat protein
MRHALMASLCCLLISPLVFTTSAKAQMAPSDQLQVGPPPQRRVEPPALETNKEDLEKKGDELRASKDYLDALDYYQTALSKDQSDSKLLNKIGITELSMHHFVEAKKYFEHSVKTDKHNSNAYNNLGVIEYVEKKYGKAIKDYKHAIALRPDMASYYSNLGSAYFSKKDFEKAVPAYDQAMALDPDVFERSSRNGISAQLAGPEDRAHYNYVMAKLYAKVGATDKALLYLRKAMEEGYPGIESVYKDGEFSQVRKDPRFVALMSAKPPGIPE